VSVADAGAATGLTFFINLDPAVARALKERVDDQWAERDGLGTPWSRDGIIDKLEWPADLSRSGPGSIGVRIGGRLRWRRNR
jgi:hypothetical protein